MSRYQVEAYSDDEAIVTPLQADGEPTGGGWVGCCGWVCLLGGVPMLALFFPAGLGLVVLGALLLKAKPTIDKAEEDMHQAVYAQGVTPSTIGWLLRTLFIGGALIVGAFLIAGFLMLAVR